MPERRTKRGAERTPLGGDYDVLICGASFAGLAIARELAGAVRADGAPARVLMIDRYEVGERQTSACGIPTVWLEALDLMGAHRQTFGELVVRTPHGSSRWPLPWTFSTFDYPRAVPAAARPGRLRVRDREGERAHRRHGPHRSRRPERPADRGRARLAPDAGRQRRLPAAGRAALARAGGASARTLGRPGNLDRPLDRARRLRLELPRARRAAHRRGLVRPALPREGQHREAGGGPRLRGRSASRGTGSRTSCARRPRTASSSSATPPATACR